MTDRKIQKRLVYPGFGFDVVLRNVPMVKLRGLWTPDIDYNKLEEALVEAVARKPVRLTGNEVRFLRLHFHLSLEMFGGSFGVTHPAVMKWEKAGDEVPAMKWVVEVAIRLFVLDRLEVAAEQFKEAYVGLRQEAPTEPQAIKLDLAQVA